MRVMRVILINDSKDSNESYGCTAKVIIKVAIKVAMTTSTRIKTTTKT